MDEQDFRASLSKEELKRRAFDLPPIFVPVVELVLTGNR